jgi:phosphoglycerate kinase
MMKRGEEDGMQSAPIALRRMQDAEVDGKIVMVRVDYNVPMQDREIKDDARIRASLRTIKTLIAARATVVLMAHLGRPDGSVVDSLRLEPIAKRLSALLGQAVTKLDDCVGDEVSAAIRSGKSGDVFMLENLRFHREEEANDPGFSSRLAALGDVYVDDAFGTLHRAHASTVGIAERLPAYAGLLVQEEIATLSRVLNDPARPYVAIVGGKKASSKLGALRDLVARVDSVLIGGGVAFTFLYASGGHVGASPVDLDLLDEVREIARLAKKRGTEIVLPSDVRVAAKLANDAETELADARRVPEGMSGFDIGPATVKRFEERIATARTIVWAGPMGAFEFAPFAEGTRGVADAIASADAFSVVGGGETGEAVEQLGYAERVSFISTGGGACLAFLRGKSLPALEVLRA